MPSLTRNEYDVLVLALSWIIGFLPLFLRDLPGVPARLRPKGEWTWVKAVGLALVASPFVRMALNFYTSIDALFVYTVLPPLPRDAMWRSVGRNLVEDFLFPVVGLLLLHNAFPGWASRRARRGRVPEMLTANGLAPRHSWGRDALRGLTLFFCIALAYLGALAIAGLFSPQQAGGDESQYWRNITIPLILLVSGVAGLTEELLFRGILLKRLGRVMPWTWAAILQAVLFGLIHAGYGTWTHVVGPAAFGLGMAWVARVLGVVPAALLHAQVNIVFFSLDVAHLNPGVYGLLVALALVNVAAAYATRLDAVRLLWRSLLARFDEVPEAGAEDAPVAPA